MGVQTGGPLSLGFRAVFQEPEACSLQPLNQDPTEESGRVHICVLFTEMQETLAALRSAEALSAGLSAEIALIVPLTVPYPLALESPPVSLGFLCRRIRQMASSVAMEIEAYVYLCRDPLTTLEEALHPGSIVVIGTRWHGFFDKSHRMARKLRRRGHHVVLSKCR